MGETKFNKLYKILNDQRKTGKEDDSLITQIEGIAGKMGKYYAF